MSCEYWLTKLSESLNIRLSWYDLIGFQIFMLSQMSQPQEYSNSPEVVTKSWLIKYKFIRKNWPSYVNRHVSKYQSLDFHSDNCGNYFSIITFSLK
jgi:hypothetical protein